MAKRIGPRMKELCRILRNMGGEAPSQYAVYSQLSYHGQPSTRFGSRAMDRAMAAGLIEVDGDYQVGRPVAVRLTPEAAEAAS